MPTPIRLALLSLLAISGLLTAENPVPPAGAGSTMADENSVLARQLAYILYAAEKVVSDNQELIDDPAKGDKGLTADVVLAKAAKYYQEFAKEPMPSSEGETRHARCVRTLLTIIRATIDKAQPLINEAGKGYKSFISPVFTDQVAREFCRTMEGVAVIRITAPTELLRNRRHKPDEWEKNVLYNQFKAATWEKGKTVAEKVEYKGKAGTRFIVPQYYEQACLKCHGEPKGERDMNGGVKEGGKLGDLGGAISVVIFDAK